MRKWNTRGRHGPSVIEGNEVLGGNGGGEKSPPQKGAYPLTCRTGCFLAKMDFQVAPAFQLYCD